MRKLSHSDFMQLKRDEAQRKADAFNNWKDKRADNGPRKRRLTYKDGLR